MQQYPTLPMTITGHTDPEAASKQRSVDNLNLSVLRAATVTRFLAQEGGLPDNQLEATGVGASQPRVSNETPAGRALNNRVEISIRVNWPVILRKVSSINLE